MSKYEKNMIKLKECIPQLYDAILQNSIENKSELFWMETAKNGMPIICAKKENKTIYLNSRYDPWRESQRYVERYKCVFDFSVMFFFGFGNGMIAQQLMEQMGKHVNFIFYEPSMQMFLLTLHNYDITHLLDDSRLSLIVCGLNDDNVEKVMAEKITIQNYQISLYNVLPLYKQLYEAEEKQIAKKYNDIINWIKININTVSFFNKSLAYNDILNMKKVFNCNCEEQFEGIFPVNDRPAIVVGAGPSLEKNIEYLRKAKGKMLILAADSALPYLCTKGVRPDIVFTVDSRKPIGIFEKTEICEIPLAIVTTANHALVNLMHGKIIYFSTECGYYNKMLRLADKTIYSMPTGGNVATAAFHMAISWGYRKIVLVGQDLAITPEKVHVGEVDTDLGIRKENISQIEVEGYNGGKVFTTPDFNSYREWYERIIRNDDNLEVINATEGGAKIQGAKQMPLKNVIEDFDGDKFDFETVIAEMPPVFNAEQRKDIIQMWEDSIRNLDMLKKKLNEGVCLLKKGLDLLDTNKYTSDQIIAIQKNVEKIVTECDGMEEIFFLNEMVLEEYGDILGDIFVTKNDDMEEIGRLFEKMQNYMNAMYEAADEVKGLFRRIIEEEM